jgi:hypothetical protein
MVTVRESEEELLELELLLLLLLLELPQAARESAVADAKVSANALFIVIIFFIMRSSLKVQFCLICDAELLSPRSVFHCSSTFLYVVWRNVNKIWIFVIFWS